MSTHTEWFNRVTEGASGRAAATKAGIPTATLNRQLAREEISAEFVIALCRAYNTSPTAGLIATGYLTPDEGTGPDSHTAIRHMPDRLLIHELARRVNSDEDAWDGTLDDVIDTPVTDLHAPRVGGRRPTTRPGSEHDQNPPPGSLEYLTPA